MNRRSHFGLALISLLVLLTACNRPSQEPVFSLVQDPLAFVDPFIGTGGHGHTHPAATVPFGLVQLGPDTRLEGWDGCSGYHYTDSAIYGFSHTHLSGTGVSDYGDILILPWSVEDLGVEESWGAAGNANAPFLFKKSDETASPGYYRVSLEENEIEAELTATAHVGIHRYRFPKGVTPRINIDLGHRDQVLEASFAPLNDSVFIGKRVSRAWAERQTVYFRIEINRASGGYSIKNPESGFAVVDEDKRTPENLSEFEAAEQVVFGKDLNVTLKFEATEELMVKVALSSVDAEGAGKNMKAEAPHWDFDKYKSDAEEEWRAELEKVRIAASPKVLKNFYTGMYHALLQPNAWSDVDGRYRGMDDQIHQADNTRVYTVFSLWDTFRAAHPLYTLLQQQRTNEFIQTFLLQHQQGGRLPVWELAANETDCMIGYHSVSVIADAWLKGIRDFDGEAALEAMVHTAELHHFGLDSYKSQGFVRAEEEPESVSKTLEYAYDDWCIAMMARDLGKHEIAERFFKRAQNWKNVFDPSTGFMRGRQNGLWFSPFDPSEVNFHFTEANSWQYSLFVPQDISGLTHYLGGPSHLGHYLDSLFTASSQTTGREQADITGLIGQYAHGNEPSHHMAYLYNFVGKPWKTQERVGEILHTLYDTLPDGLSGNEDCGQMSAWYVFSAMGFYPVTPGAGTYIIGLPVVQQAEISLENGNTFQILAPGAGSLGYIQSVTLNGQPLDRSWISHAEIMAGGKLEFTLGAEPNEKWARETENWPKTSIEAYPQLPVPAIHADSRTFSDELEVSIALPPSVDGRIYFTTDGSEPRVPGKVYTSRFRIDSTTTVKAIAFRPDWGETPVISATFHKIDPNRRIDLRSAFAPQYSAGGDRALIDGLRGGKDFRTGTWQGFRESLDATVDLGSAKEIHYIGLGCLQDTRSWILMPKWVEFSVSEDGKNWRKLPSVQTQVDPKDEESQTEELGQKIPGGEKARYVKVHAEHFGNLPEWHLGAGGKAWLFVDELVIR